MLTLVPSQPPQLDEARLMLWVAESYRSLLTTLAQYVLLPLVAIGLIAVGVLWAGALLLGASVSLALHRHGPSWWPGRR